MKDEVKKIIEKKYFIGSGVDTALDKGVRTKLDIYGQYVPDYKNTSDVENTLKVTLNSSVSMSEDGLAESLFSSIAKVKYNEYIGYYLDLHVGYVKKGSFRKNASSGGFVSWVAVKLLEAGEIDGFVHVKKSKKPGTLFEYGISRTASEIKSGAKSRYYPAELSSALDEVKKKPGRYAVVGIPEIISELRLLAKQDKVVGERLKYYFGLVCGHQKTTKYAEAIAWEYGIRPGDLEDIDFRVKKATGRAIEYDMKFTGLVDGQRRTFTVRNNEPFVSSWAHGFFKARFSDFTDNSFNELADITFGDAWLEEYAGDPMGNNILIVRNKKIAKLIKEGVDDKELSLDIVDEETIIRSQQGLIHHTRDELPYRLHKEARDGSWVPEKRVEPDDTLNDHRKKVQDVRQKIAESSHELYRQAVERDDFEWFRKGMEPEVAVYKELYGQPAESKRISLVNFLKKRKENAADGAILTLTGYFNYGNVVQRFALQHFLKMNGLNFISIVHDHRGAESHFPVGRKTKIKTPLRAVKRFMKYEKPYWRLPEVEELYPGVDKHANLIRFVNDHIWIKTFDRNDHFKAYIVGSDQVWRNWWNDREILGYYFYNFLKGRKSNKISYAASFGKDDVEDVMSKDDVEYIKPYIQDFDAISVREKSGETLIKEAWGIKDVKTVVDPTLLLDAEIYSGIIDSSDVRFEKIQPIFTYMLGETDENRKFIHKVQDEKQQAITAIRAHAGAENDILPPVELWLKGFRDAELVITNSFHGMMFSVINNTDFIIIGKDAGGLSRIFDFLGAFGIEGRFVSEADLGVFDISNIKPIDWKSVNKKLSAARRESGDWLLSKVR